MRQLMIKIEQDFDPIPPDDMDDDEVWNQYLSGDVWGYVIEDEDGEHVDSCLGFYGEENCRREAQDMMKQLEAEEVRAEEDTRRVCAL